MALSVLDGNQSATTLSSVVTGGEHIVAHSVVSLGANAIANITSAVSGSVVSISNFPATQPISGSVSISGTPSVTFGQAVVSASNIGNLNDSVGTDGGTPTSTKFIKIGGHQDGQNQVEHIVHVSAGGAMKVDASDSSVTFGLASVTFSAVSISNFPSTQTIAGTVTANVFGQDENNTAQRLPLIETDGISNATREMAVSSIIVDNDGKSIFNHSDGVLGIPIAARRLGNSAAIDYITAENNRLDTNVKNSVTIGSLPAISGTVTVGAMPNGSLTTRFGTPTTANTAFATSAVTNASRKYLLIQNVTTGSNVITVGIGFTPTATQGIQLTAGAGITFESSYIPTGAVYILSSVTQSNFTVLEA